MPVNTNSENVECCGQKYGQSRSTLRNLGELGKRIGTTSLLRSVRPSVRPPSSVRMEQHDSHWTDFREISYLTFF
jgi:hypothetical protein